MQKNRRKRREEGKREGGKPVVRSAESGPLAHASSALGEVLMFKQPTDAVLSTYFRAHRELGQRDRAYVADSVYGVVRRLRSLQAVAGQGATPRELVLAWLACGEQGSISDVGQKVSAAEAEWMASLKQTAPETPSTNEQLDLPDWLIERLSARLGEARLRGLAEALNQPAPLDLRVNVQRMTRDALLAEFVEAGIEAEACRLSPHGLRLPTKPTLQQHPRFLDGSFEVQDEGSQLLSLLMQPRRGELIVDFCAGAGGKTLHLGAMMRSTGRVYAFDVSERRLARLKMRAARAGLSSVHPAVIAHENDARVKRLVGKVDRVLVDAPCSGLGTLRRSPELKWRQTPEVVAEMAVRQSAILRAAATLVKPNGRLVYATCSLLDEENDAVVDAFLDAHPQFSLLHGGEILRKQGVDVGGERLRLFPDEHDTDGFFAVTLERRNG